MPYRVIGALAALAALTVVAARAEAPSANGTAHSAQTPGEAADILTTVDDNTWSILTGGLGDVLRLAAMVELAMMRPGGIALAAQGVAAGVAPCDNPMIDDVARSATTKHVQLRITAIRDIQEVSASWATRRCRADVQVNGGDWRQAIFEIRLLRQTSRVTFTVN